MTNIDREQVTVLTRQTNATVEVWRRKRREALARQLVANAEIKQIWQDSNPIEIRQQQQSYHAKTKVQGSAGAAVPLEDLQR
ncbi:MAG TPA: hypothetical protein VFZ34_25920 [Blastocatellia bacterium]|nr:hypothetical protein [Blastocatellia bacterium]